MFYHVSGPIPGSCRVNSDIVTCFCHTVFMSLHKTLKMLNIYFCIVLKVFRMVYRTFIFSKYFNLVRMVLDPNPPTEMFLEVERIQGTWRTPAYKHGEHTQLYTESNLGSGSTIPNLHSN